ncbi:nuclease-related domain-containing protein [Pseudarthrobacter sp. NPDC058362]|uniref:nuclease-related domain-containing protein n=1 Tax=Pseudarthrobacter sp. NPDC058362 TaxID=3346458 RepID=UPI00365C556D
MGAAGGRAGSGGADDGRHAAGTLDEALAALVHSGWQQFHEVNWPGRPQARLDHVLVGPGGIVVVDAKDWTGDVRVVSGGLWQDRYARPQAVEGALAQCAAVTSVVEPRYRRLVRPLICMTAQTNLFGITRADVPVVGPGQVVRAIGLLPEVLDREDVAGLHKSLGRTLTGDQQAGLAGFPRRVPARGGRPARRKERHGRASGAGYMPPKEWDPSQYGRPAMAHPGRTAGPHFGAITAGRLALLAAFVVFAVFFLPPGGP